MPELEPDDRARLKAAEGWLGLGDYEAANDELEQVSPAKRAHPDALYLRWHVYALAGKWQVCLVIAKALTRGGTPTTALLGKPGREPHDSGFSHELWELTWTDKYCAIELTLHLRSYVTSGARPHGERRPFGCFESPPGLCHRLIP